MSDAPHSFPLHLGDYLRDTRDLSLLQHGAYLMLMIDYYVTAKPPANDLERIYRRAGAHSHEEKQAVQHVLGTYFLLKDGFWTHKRIEQELGKWGLFTEAQRAKAEKKWKEYRENKATGNAAAHATAMPKHMPAFSLKPLAYSRKPKHLALSATAPDSAASLPTFAAGAVLVPGSPVVVKIPLNDKTEFEVTKVLAEEFAALYPAVDVMQTLKEIRGWNLTHPEKRKTRRGILAHINGWMQKEQNRG